MATTSPDNLRTPDPGDPYNLVPDLATLAGDVQAALLLRDNNTGSGTASQRTAFTSTAPDGFLWQDTDGIKMIWRKDGAVWVPAVWRWAGTTVQRTGFSAPNGFEWEDTSDNCVYLRLGGAWVFRSSAAAGFAYRGANSVTYSNATVWGDLGVLGAYPTQTLLGGVTWNNGFTVPQAGDYEVRLTQTTTGNGSIFGLTTVTGVVDYSTNRLNTGHPLVAGIGGTSQSTRMSLAAGQTVRAVVVAQSTSPAVTLTPSQGVFEIRRVG